MFKRGDYMQYAVYTTGTHAQIIINKLRSDNNPVYVIKRASWREPPVEKCCGIPVISIFSAIKKWHTEIHKILVPSIIDDDTDYHVLRDELHNAGFSDGDIIYAPVEAIFTKGGFSTKDCKEYNDLHYIEYLEFQIADRCNMNCLRCSHYSNLIPDAPHPLFKEIEKDLIQLRNIIDHIYKIRIMGGEPLLNREMIQYVQLVHRLFPCADIRITTNGLLLNSLDNEDRAIIKECSAAFDFSVYPVMVDKADKIIEQYASEGIAVHPELITTFTPTLRSEKSPYPFRRLTCSCTMLRQGMIAPCPEAFHIKTYNKIFNTKYPDQCGMYSIYRDNLIYAQLMDELSRPFDLCDYCCFWDNNTAPLPWENGISKVNRNDWIFNRKESGICKSTK